MSPRFRGGTTCSRGIPAALSEGSVGSLPGCAYRPSGVSGLVEAVCAVVVQHRSARAPSSSVSSMPPTQPSRRRAFSRARFARASAPTAFVRFGDVGASPSFSVTAAGKFKLMQDDYRPAGIRSSEGRTGPVRWTTVWTGGGWKLPRNCGESSSRAIAPCQSSIDV